MEGKGISVTKKKVEPVEEGVQITPEEAQKVIQDKRRERVAAVEKGIQDLCAAHNCVIDVQITLSIYSKPTGQVVVIPRD